ncbi:MAG: hypothetical protein ACI4O3_06800 [Oscillospiraceae bacterium]
MNYTENYQLCQWEASDPIRREDFNADNAAIDAALKALADGALKIQVGSYVGTGKCALNGSSLTGTPPTLTPGFKPSFVLVYGYGYMGLFFRGSSTGTIKNFSSGGSYNSVLVEWSDDSVRWYHSSASTDTAGELSLNYLNVTYWYAIFG